MKHIEDQHQMALVAWMNLQPELRGRFFHPANGGKRNAREAARFKRLGVMAGVSDIFVAIPAGGFHGLFIELKAPKPHASRVTKAQDEFARLMEEEGYFVDICYGWDEARARIINYLLPSTKEKSHVDSDKAYR